MLSTRPALRLLQALLGLMLLVGAWQVAGPAAPDTGHVAARIAADDGSLAAFTDVGGGWTVALADDAGSDLFDDGTDPDDSGTIVRVAGLEQPPAQASLTPANPSQAPPRLFWFSPLSTGPPAA